LALAAGGRDNISAVVVEVTGFSARTPDDTDTNPRQHGVPAQADGAVDTEPRVPPLGLDADGPG
jgi:hypothetical protein